MTEHRLDAAHVHYTWSRRHEARLSIQPGDVVNLQTRDGFDGQLEGLTSKALASDISVLDFARIAPLTGPIEIAGAVPGDTLVIELLELTPTGPGWAVIWPSWPDFDYFRPDAVPRRGSIHPFASEALLADDVEVGGITFSLAPMLGMIGTAPEAGDFMTLPPRRFGGNMDCRLVGPGTTVYLPIEVPGALVSFGDGHAVQGDGEISTTGLECSMELRARIDIDRSRAVRGPELRTATHHYVLEHARDLATAVRGAIARAHAYLIEDRGLSAEDAYLLLGLSARLEISELVDTPYVGVRLGIPAMRATNGQ